jgi:zinc D-Ala-D-Ala carboxypeptidase
MLLAVIAFALLWGTANVFPDEDVRPPPLSPLAIQLAGQPPIVTRDGDGRAVAVYGVPSGDARIILLPVTRVRPLPDGYTPPDLAHVGGRLVRSMVVPDLTAMIDAADADGVDLAPISAYRSPGEQAMAFESAIWQAVGRSGGTLSREEAEQRAGRFVAPPGRSQHQLGTAIDFSSWEIGYAVQERFADTETARWLEAHAWQYGFVLPYPRHGEGRTGYAYEPWHYRWIGRDLAAILQRDGYLAQPTLVVDDYLRAVEELMGAERLP